MTAETEKRDAVASGRTVYCLGFLFSEDREWVVLMQKARPEWQAGKFNGIGGHVEPGETPLGAMKREAIEEAGVVVEWELFAGMFGADWTVHCFRAFDTEAAEEANHGDGDEPLSYVPVARVRDKDCIQNLHWLIALALDWEVKGYAWINYTPTAAPLQSAVSPL